MSLARASGSNELREYWSGPPPRSDRALAPALKAVRAIHRKLLGLRKEGHLALYSEAADPRQIPRVDGRNSALGKEFPTLTV